jgi:hypothetical protein
MIDQNAAVVSELGEVDGALQAIEGGQSVNSVGSKAWANKLRKRAQTLSKELDTGYMELGKILYEVCSINIDNVKTNKPVFTLWGYDTFADYAEKELNLHRKKAERYRSIWYTLDVRLKNLDDASKARLVSLGSSKMRELVRVVDENNANPWLDLAERVSCVQLEAKVKQAIDDAKKAQAQQKLASQVTGGETSLIEGTPFGDETDDVLGAATPSGAPADQDDDDDDSEPDAVGDGGAVSKAPSQVAMASAIPLEGEDIQFMHFGLFPEQFLIVAEALERVKELSKSDKKGHNLSMICTDFLATNDFIGGAHADETKARYLSKIEKLMGVRLVAVDVKSKDVVYGIGTLEKMSKAGS